MAFLIQISRLLSTENRKLAKRAAFQSKLEEHTRFLGDVKRQQVGELLQGHLTALGSELRLSHPNRRAFPAPRCDQAFQLRMRGRNQECQHHL